MHLYISLKMLAEDLFGNESNAIERKFLLEITGKKKRTVNEYLRTGEIPNGTWHKAITWLARRGIPAPEPFDKRINIQKEWLSFCSAALKNESAFLPKTFTLISTLAQKDIEFISNIGTEDTLSSYKKYLTDEVAPLYCKDRPDLIKKIKKAPSIEELKIVQYRIFVLSIIYLLSHAEAEYFTICGQNTGSILADFLPTQKNTYSPSKLFFNSWLDNLSLDKEGFIEEMLDHFHNRATNNSQEEYDDAEKAKTTLSRQYERYIEKGLLPDHTIPEQWAKGLYWKSVEEHKHDHTPDQYKHSIMDTYYAVRILHKIHIEIRPHIPQEEAIHLLSTYKARLTEHFKQIKKG